jgi:hypothetical protein
LSSHKAARATTSQITTVTYLRVIPGSDASLEDMLGSISAARAAVLIAERKALDFQTTDFQEYMESRLGDWSRVFTPQQVRSLRPAASPAPAPD